MKNYMIIVVAAVLSISFQSVRYGSAADGKPELTAAILSGTKWGPEHQGGKYVNFKTGGVYDGREDYIQDGMEIAGTYVITGGKVDLMDGKRASYLTGGVLMEDLSSLRFTRYLQFGRGVKLWDLNSKAPAGRNVAVGGIKAVAMGMKNGSVTTNAKLRSGPSQTSGEMTFERFKASDEAMDTEKLVFLPAGTPVLILARTERKMIVQQWENYWFYVEVEEPIDHWKKGWVFAEFIKVE